MRLLHTMLRVKNLQQSIDFYTQVMGMKLLRQKDYPNGEFTLAFLGYGEETTHTVLELTYNWGKTEYEMGSYYGHIAISVADVTQFIEKFRQQREYLGGEIMLEPYVLKNSNTLMAFIKDPDGYEIEILARG